PPAHRSRRRRPGPGRPRPARARRPRRGGAQRAQGAAPRPHRVGAAARPRRPADPHRTGAPLLPAAGRAAALTRAATPPNLARFRSMATAKGIKRQAFGLFLLAAAIGTAGGLLGAGFLHALQWLQHAVIVHDGHLAGAVRHLPFWRCLLTPAAGGLVAGLFLLLMRRRGNPFGISDIIGLVQLRKGTIRLRESLLQLASSACT